MNKHFSTAFPKENTNIVPLTENGFSGKDSEYLSKVIVAPSMVIGQIGTMKEILFPGVGGIPITCLNETAQKLSIPLIIMFNLSLTRGMVPGEWKELTS